MTDDEFAYDVAYEEAMADIIVIRQMLLQNRPLEALYVANEAYERYEDSEA